jgi:hypothetical protein
MKYTFEKLEKMSAKERRDALNNNKSKLSDPKFAELASFNIALIESSGLGHASEKQLEHGDWQLREIEIIINDPANEAAMLKAVAQGEPPLGAIEHLIATKLGNEYRSKRRDTVEAGYLVAKRLYALGYEKIEGGDKKMPPGSVAKTAATFRKKKTGT